MTTLDHEPAVEGKPAARGARRASRLAVGILPALCAALVMAGCSSVPKSNERLIAAQSALERARADTARAELTPTELERADAAVRRAEREWRDDDDTAEVDHLAYLAQRQVDLAVTTGQRREAERGIEQVSRERDAIQLEQSRRQTDSAQAQATTAQMQAEQERQRADQLASRLRELQAKETERGLVVTFSDVLFDVGLAELRPGALARVDQLAAVMREYPERNVLVEGFTDSTGSQTTNQELSERRAMSVRQALVMRGVDPKRIVARGHASRYPIADNSTADGRQQNRRVEAVLSDAKGNLPMRN